MALAAQLVLTDREQRAFARTPLGADATLRADDGAPVDAEVREISRAGCRFIAPSALSPGDRISLGIAGLPLVHGTVIRSEGARHACMFDRPLASADWSAVGIDNVHLWSSDTSFTDSLAERDDERWAPRARLMTIVGLAALGWVGIVALAF